MSDVLGLLYISDAWRGAVVVGLTSVILVLIFISVLVFISFLSIIFIFISY